MQCNLVNNDYQDTSKVLFTFAPNKQHFGRSIIISLHSLTIMNTANAEFSSVKFGLQIKSVKHLKLKIMLI